MSAKRFVNRNRDDQITQLANQLLRLIPLRKFLCYQGIPQKQMTVVLDTSSKDPLHSLSSMEILGNRIMQLYYLPPGIFECTKCTVNHAVFRCILPWNHISLG